MSWHSGLQLRVVDGPGLDGITDLGQPRLAIGRSRGAPGERAPGWVFLEDRSVSRQHAELVWEEDLNAYRLLHLSQTNLTWVNGDPVTDRVLKVGDRVKIGPVQLLLEKTPVTAPPPPPAEPPAPAPPPPPVPTVPRPATFTAPPPPSAARPAPALPLPTAPRAPVPLPASGGPQREGLMLEVGSKSIALDAAFITIGRDNQQLEPSAEDPRVFDLLIEMSDPDFRPNHLILTAHERGFEVLRNPQVPPVKVLRAVDGLHWEAWLLDQPALLKAGDSLVIGSSTLRLARITEGAPGPRRVTL